MMSNKDIVEKYIVRNDKVMDAFHKITLGETHKDDLFQDICEYVLEYDNDKLNNIINNGENDFRYWIVHIFSIQVKSPRSPYHYKYRKPVRDMTDIQTQYTEHCLYQSNEYNELESEMLNENLIENKVAESFDKIKKDLTYYQRELFQLWLDCGAEKGSYQRMYELTKIPVYTIGADIREIKEYLQNRIRHDIDEHI